MNIREIGKTILRRISPELFFAAKALSARIKFRRRYLARQRAVRPTLFAEHEPWVMGGPFSGMSYLDEVVWGPIEPKWLGTYECELHPVFESLNFEEYRSIVDIGSAEGYYSVGMARLNPAARVSSYDVDPWARRQQRRLVKMNGTKNVVIGAHCDSAELERQIIGPTLVVCDAEGYEYELFAPHIDNIEMCDLLIEVHAIGARSAREGAEELRRRFADTHHSRSIPVAPRVPSNFPQKLRGVLGQPDVLSLMDEHRESSQSWLWLHRRSA